MARFSSTNSGASGGSTSASTFDFEGEAALVSSEGGGGAQDGGSAPPRPID